METLGSSSAGLTAAQAQELLEAVTGIRSDLQFILYGLFPVAVSIAILAAAGWWFYRTFIDV